jgi:regulator of protease activity HflC (stomatin/prohibitin superfamily)
MSTNLKNTQERAAVTMSGGAIFVLALVMLGLVVWAIFQQAGGDPIAAAVLVVLIVLFLAASKGFYTLQPNEAAAILLFSNYKGTDRTPGLRWTWPWYGRKKISLRVRNVTSQTLKVNDRRGSPIEIAAVIVWRVVDTGQALFDVDQYESFVNIQIETALREIASHFAYDHGSDSEPSLRSDADKVSALLREKLGERVTVAGVAIDEAKLSHLAYAPEIAGAMLRSQQAEAILAARKKIVEGAVNMVEDALAQLSARSIVVLDDERRAAMVSNLLVVLCGDRDAQPVVNAGTIYS